MGIIKRHLDRELSKKNKDDQLILELKKIVSSGTLTFSDWQLSGKFIPTESFKKECPDVKLDDNCTDVILYYGDIFIQVLKSDNFYVSPGFVSNDIKSSEKELWDRNLKKLF